MAESRSRDEWNRTACTMALLANLNRDPKKRAPYKPSDFHPLERERKAPDGKTGIGILKAVFVDAERKEVNRTT
jgi:hypothetical protein